jgi:hypothetical protein
MIEGNGVESSTICMGRESSSLNKVGKKFMWRFEDDRKG